MTSFVHVDFPRVHPGVERAERTVELLTPVVKALAAMREPVVRFFGSLAEARRLTIQNAQYRAAAMQDARLMADISRAMASAADSALARA